MKKWQVETLTRLDAQAILKSKEFSTASPFPQIIFETHDFTYHGHPTPLACPRDEVRKSLILHYYTALPRPESQVAMSKPHRAMWRRLQLKELS